MLSSQSACSRVPLRTLLLVAVWFGVWTGLLEALGLLLFQRVNWARWGAMIHVSWPILWVSILVDVGLFLLLAFLVAGVARLTSRVQALKSLVFLLAFLACCDWLTVTGRLRVASCVLLALGVAAVFARWMQSHELKLMAYWKRTAPWMAAAGILIFALVQGGARYAERAALAKLPVAPADSPNVLVIIVDTLRADHLSAYGYSRPTSPNIDRLAAEGALFQNAVSAASWSLPSHVSMLTGRYQFEHGVGDVDGTPIRDSKIPPLGGYPSLGEALESLGYRTGAFSANRSYFTANLGFERGFQHFEDYFHSTSDSLVRTTFGGQLAGLYLKATRNSTVARILRSWGWDSLLDANFEGAGGLSGAHVRKRAGTVNQEVLDWIDRGGEGHPFFAVLNYFDAHNPYGGPPNYPKPAWPQSTSIDQYDDGVKYIDDSVGALMTGLVKRGLTGKTMVIVTSDHGESLGQHGLAYHGHSLYHELIHVPLVLWYPGHVPPGTRVSSPVANSAIPATVMDILGEREHKFPGRPLNGYWGSAGPPADSAGELSELAEEHFLEPEDEGADKRIPLGTTGAMKSILGDRWHLILHKKFGNQLYDWVNDPTESKNLIHTRQGEEATSKMMSGLEDRLAGTGSGEAPASSAHPLKISVEDDETPAVQMRNLDGAVNDYYRFQAEPGDLLAFNVKPTTAARVRSIDSVVTITDAEGQPLEACRDPEDDSLRAPGAADPTPELFDDVCINDDISPGVQSDSQLQILVPGTGDSPVELYVRVSDWNGRVGPGLKYQIEVKEIGASSVLKTASR